MRVEGLRDIVALEMWCVSRSDRPRALAEWPTMLDIDKAHYYKLADAALAAVAPAIEAAALERAAVACSELEVHSTSSRNPGIKRKIKVGPAVAAIIRALKETT